MFTHIPAADLIRALTLLLKYNPEAAISASKEPEYQADIILCGGRFTGHRMTPEDDAEMSRLGWGCCVRTETGNEDAGFWERSVDHDHSRERE